ncbi:MAG: pyrophosphorylase [Acidimicrobiales bacterium]|nr:pyrophosphorylase [Acidimicrobiales bacterium]
MTRVLSTDAAKSAITTMASIIDGGLADQIAQLDQQGRQLSQPEVWDGSLAIAFRSAWPQTSKTLQHVRNQLDELRVKIESINTNIMAAGGN